MEILIIQHLSKPLILVSSIQRKDIFLQSFWDMTMQSSELFLSLLYPMNDLTLHCEIVESLNASSLSIINTWKNINIFKIYAVYPKVQYSHRMKSQNRRAADQIACLSVISKSHFCASFFLCFRIRCLLQGVEIWRWFHQVTFVIQAIFSWREQIRLVE